MEQVATLGGREEDAAECRRLADLLNLDAVGVVRVRAGHRRMVWWASSETDVVPLEQILEGRAPEWISISQGDDVVFAHLTEGSTARSASALSGMLASLLDGGRDRPPPDPSEENPDDRIERERARLAYAIHDGLTQVVTATVLDLEWHARRADLSPGQAVEAISAAAGQLREALDEIRSLLASLSTPAETPARPLEEVVQDVMDRWQLPAAWSVEGDLHAVPRPVLDAASSVIREGVANAAKHSASRDVAVRVRASRAAIEVRVEDRGKGFRPTGTGLHAGHLGMEMMRRRVAEVNGTLDVESSPGKGTRVVARLPVNGQGAKP